MHLILYSDTKVLSWCSKPAPGDGIENVNNKYNIMQIPKNQLFRVLIQFSIHLVLVQCAATRN